MTAILILLSILTFVLCAFAAISYRELPPVRFLTGVFDPPRHPYFDLLSVLQFSPTTLRERPRGERGKPGQGRTPALLPHSNLS